MSRNRRYKVGENTVRLNYRVNLLDDAKRRYELKTPGTEMRGGRGRLQQQAPSDIRNTALKECAFCMRSSIHNEAMVLPKI